MSVMSKKEKFEGYIDTSGDFSNASLKRAEFYLTHKILFKKIIIGILISWGSFSILFGLFFWGKYFFFDYQQDNINVYNMVNTGVSKAILQKNKPVDLQISNKYIFASSKDKYDFAVEVANPNKYWIANITYKFYYDNGQTEHMEAVFLPGDSRFLPVYGVESMDIVPNNIKFQLIDVSWQRVDVHDVFDTINYISERVNISIENINFESFGTGSNVGKLLSFDVVNNTLFGYKTIDLVVVLRSNGEVVGLTPLQISNVEALSSQNISLSLFNNNLMVDSVELQPVLNVFDDSIYLSL